jgi:type IV secretory pathway TraG/TraD family ATPase VirD4
LDGHVLLVGGIGQGKTNTMYHLLERVQGGMGVNDVAVIFDPKGDYLKFRRPGDIVINDPSGKDAEPWSLLAELAAARDEKGSTHGESEDLDETASEIAHTLFDDARERTQQIFFPTAAMQIFAATLRHHRIFGDPNIAHLSNASIVAYWNQRQQEDIVNDLLTVPEARGLAHYISGSGSAQGMALGVLSEIVQVVRDVFVGRFRTPGGFSIRRAVRDRGAKCIFIEYRIRAGKAQAPLYRILVDLAIKEALSTSLPARGRVYFFLDEFRLLPRLAHLDNGVNFGREFGLRFFAGMQSHAQVKAAYAAEADSILSGFNSVFAFRTTNRETREFIQGIGGRNKKLHVISLIPGQTLQQIVDGQVVEDHDIWDLAKGQAVVFLPNCDPFVANVNLHDRKRTQ